MTRTHRNYLLIIAGLVVVIILQRSCTPGCVGEVITEEHTDTIWGDTTPRIIEVDVPRPVYMDTGSTRWRTLDIDTTAILVDYFARIYYSDTITDDSTFRVIVMDTVSMNRIKHRAFSFQDLSPLVINTTVISKPRRKLFVGANIGSDLTSLGAGPSLLLQGRKDQTYGYSFDMLNKRHEIAFFWKISLRKKKSGRMD